MCYVFKDRSNRFLYENKEGKFIPTDDERLADTYSTKTEAENVQKRLCRPHRKTFSIYSIGENQRILFTIEEPQKNKLDDINWNDIINKSNEISELQNRINSFNSYISDLSSGKEVYINNLIEKLRQTDYARNDLLHYIEERDYKLNAIEICRWFKLISKYTKERRSIKNKIRLAKSVQSEKVDYNYLVSELEHQKNPMYNYRYLTNIKELIAR